MNALTSGLLAALGAPMLLLAMAGWGCWAAWRRVCAAVAPRPVESEWDGADPGRIAGRRPQPGPGRSLPVGRPQALRSVPRRGAVACAEPWLVN